MEHRNNIQQILERNSAAWRCPELGKCITLCHEIDTGCAQADSHETPKIVSRETKRGEAPNCRNLLEAGAIENAKGPWAAPLVLVPKKGGEWRMCVDFRELNQVTKKDAYPLPLIDSLMRMFDGSSYFSTLGLEGRLPSSAHGEQGSGEDRIYYSFRAVPIRCDAIWAVQCSSDIPAFGGHDIRKIYRPRSRSIYRRYCHICNHGGST